MKMGAKPIRAFPSHTIGRCHGKKNQRGLEGEGPHLTSWNPGGKIDLERDHLVKFGKPTKEGSSVGRRKRKGVSRKTGRNMRGCFSEVTVRTEGQVRIGDRSKLDHRAKAMDKNS